MFGVYNIDETRISDEYLINEWWYQNADNDFRRYFAFDSAVFYAYVYVYIYHYKAKSIDGDGSSGFLCCQTERADKKKEK